MRKLSNRLFLSLGLLTLAAAFLTANVSTAIDFDSGSNPAATSIVSHQHQTSSINSQESGHAKKDQKSEGAIEVYEEQDSEKSTSKRFLQVGQLSVLISFALALILIYRKGRHQLLWLAHSLEPFTKSYILFRVFRI